MSYVIDKSDAITRANGALVGSTLDNALGGSGAATWTVLNGGTVNWVVASNAGVNTEGTYDAHILGISSATAVTGQKLTGTCVGATSSNGAGFVLRYDVATGHYYIGFATLTSSAIYKYTGTFSALVATGPAFADDDVMAFEAQGTNPTTLTLYKNGSVVQSANDGSSPITSGVPAMDSDGFGIGFKDVIYETGTATTPTNLGITTAPVGNQSGVAFTTQPVIAVRDAGNSTVTGDTSTVTVAITVLTGSVTLGGTTSKAAVTGVATFTNLAPSGTGSYTLTFTDGSLTTVTTGTLYVGATQLAITSVSAPTYSKHPTTVVVTAKDAGGTVVANYTGTVAVTLNKLSGAGSVATMTGGTSSAAAVAGVATLTPIATTSDNGLVATSFTYTAAASGLTSATTATITPTVSESIAVTIT